MDEYSSNNHIFLPLSFDRNNSLKEPIRINILAMGVWQKRKKLRN